MQTSEGKRALERCEYACEWCQHRRGIMVNVFYIYPNYFPAQSGGSHHLLRRKVDDIRTILGLCGKCHTNHHRGNSPTTFELASLMLEIHGFDIWELWPEFIKPK